MVGSSDYSVDWLAAGFATWGPVVRYIMPQSVRAFLILAG